MSTSTNSTTEEKKINITLTGARPVNVLPSAWPLIAEGHDKWFDNQYGFQANRRESWSIKVRQHAKGCALVYGVYTYDSQYQGESDYDIRAGFRLVPGADLIAAIERAAEMMETAVYDDKGDSASTFRRIGRECIADLPAEDLDCCPEVS